jgi:cytidylate kinase
MENSQSLFIKYMVDSFDRKAVPPPLTKTGPFITISREYGCQANKLAKLLCDEFLKNGQKWNILNKEIIMESAKKLDMEPGKVMKIAESVDRTAMDEVLHALTTKYYKSDRKIRQTIASVVNSAAAQGNTIIVGRGGVAITHGMNSGIHIKLMAPREWRLQVMMQRYHTPREYMMKELSNIDLKRHRLLASLTKGVENPDMLFDVEFNCSTLNLDEIAKMVMALVNKRFLTK